MDAHSTSNRLNVPPDIAKASPAYRFRLWLALLGLFLFVAFYLGLAGWFTYNTYRMILAAMVGGDGAVMAMIAAVPSAFLAIFMWKALFFVRPGSEDPGLEIKSEDQPELFEFLYNLADEIGAPRPHKVFLSPNVNASVFYDLSLLNFFFASKKNLTIGLGLVNVLNRTEFKAVLAHEFGHFAQRSMAVGRGVYVGEQIAAHMIAKRDFLDSSLDFLSSIDLRVAWIGWIMRTIVWSIRSLMETAFRWVVVAHRALSREMEFQADLVAVSVTGSDALINALYKLQPADEDWDRSLNFASLQFNKERQVLDMFAVQSRVSQLIREIENDPTHGAIPDREPAVAAAEHRLFSEQIAQPPRMWSTHPSNTEREENAKRTYVPAPASEDSAWTLFRDPQAVREEVTRFLFKDVKFEKEPTLLSSVEAARLLEEQYSHESFDTAYQGAYLGRSVSLGVPQPEMMFADIDASTDVRSSIGALYPQQLRETMAKWRNLEEELAQLEAIESGYFDASGGVIRHRGKVIPRSKLKPLIEQVKLERDAVQAEVEQHDRQCRTLHRAAAAQVAPEWVAYLESLNRLLHYAEHSEADLDDAHGHLANVFNMAIATGRVNESKLRKILASANDLQSVMADLDRQCNAVELPEAILKDLEVANWRASIEELQLPRADRHNIQQWIEVADSWIIPMKQSFSHLRRATLDELLRCERYVAEVVNGTAELRPAPPPAKSPDNYPKRPRGKERPRQKRLDWWSRFTLADGKGPAFMRFAVAASIVGAVIAVGTLVGSATVLIYNGLAIPVKVSVNHRQVTVPPYQHRSLLVGSVRTASVTASANDGREIEAFEPPLDRAFASYVYNVANAAPLVRWSAAYGTATPRPPQFLGCPRWHISTADYHFEEPPREIKMSTSGTTRSVLSSESNPDPALVIQSENVTETRNRAIRAHARFDSADSRYITDWLGYASELPDFEEILAERLRNNPADIPSLRFQQSVARNDAKDEVLAAHRKLAAEHPDDPNLQYIGIRALPDGPEQDEKFIAALAKWPDNPWLNNAVAYVRGQRQQWQAALQCFDRVLQRKGPLYDSAALESARILRLVNDDPHTNLRRFSDTRVAQILALEQGSNFSDSPLIAYSLLNQGKLEEAYSAAGGESAEAHILILLAASTKAQPEWQQRALIVPVEEISDPGQLLMMASLAARLGKPYEAYLERFEEAYPARRRSPANYVRAMIERGSSGASLNEEIDDLGPQYRALVLASAIILSPESTQDDWKRMVNLLLFAPERPAL